MRMQLSVRCKHCGKNLTFPVHSATDLINSYDFITNLYRKHLEKKHNDFLSMPRRSDIRLRTVYSVE